MLRTYKNIYIFYYYNIKIYCNNNIKNAVMGNLR